MQKKVLISADDSRHSKNAVQYAVQASAMVPKLHFVLFHVQPMISLFLQEEARKKHKTRIELEKLIQKNDSSARKLLEELRDEMVRKGIGADRIEITTRQRKQGLAKDILEYSQSKHYDAIVIGRRGLSRLQEMIMGSASANIVEHSQVIPVWLVDGDATGNKIMVAVDGSESSLRAIDHLSFMLSGNPDLNVTLLHVTSKARDYCEVNFDEAPSEILEEVVARGDKACIDQFYTHALQKFKSSGFSEDQLEMTTIKGGNNTGRHILEAAQKGHYSTLVIGRRGVDKAFFMGSVSRYIISKASNCALWIVP